LLRVTGPRTNTPERQGGAPGENPDKPLPTARRGRLQHPLEMPPRARHRGIAIEVVLSHTSPERPAAAATVRTPAPYQRTERKRRQALGRTALPAGSIDGVIRQAERTHAWKARVRILSAVNGEVGTCHSGLRSPVRHGAMRAQTFVMMSVRTAVDVAVSRWVQGRLPAWPWSDVGLNGAGTGRSEL
jgi:hypothetical protein